MNYEIKAIECATFDVNRSPSVREKFIEFICRYEQWDNWMKQVFGSSRSQSNMCHAPAYDDKVVAAECYGIVQQVEFGLKRNVGLGEYTTVEEDNVTQFKPIGVVLTPTGGAAVPGTPITWVGQCGKVNCVLTRTGTGHDVTVTSLMGAFTNKGYQPEDQDINQSARRWVDQKQRAFDHIERRKAA